MNKSEKVYQCNDCGETFKDKEEAMDCCPPHILYKCLVCSQCYSLKEDADNCKYCQHLNKLGTMNKREQAIAFAAFTSMKADRIDGFADYIAGLDFLDADNWNELKDYSMHYNAKINTEEHAGKPKSYETIKAIDHGPLFQGIN